MTGSSEPKKPPLCNPQDDIQRGAAVEDVQAPLPTTQNRTHMRKLSLEAYGVTKQPVKVEQLPGGLDDFGLPARKRPSRASSVDSRVGEGSSAAQDDEQRATFPQPGGTLAFRRRSRSARGNEERSRSASATRDPMRVAAISEEEGEDSRTSQDGEDQERGRTSTPRARSRSAARIAAARERSLAAVSRTSSRSRSKTDGELATRRDSMASEAEQRRSRADTMSKVMETNKRNSAGVSEWSHQALAPKNDEVIEEKEEEEWQDMPALGEYDIYDDEGRLVAKGNHESDEDDTKGGAGRGYTRVQIDDDARSTTSMDENTSYLFKEKGANVVYEDDDVRDPLAQMQATKDLLTEGQRIAYVGVTRLAMIQLLKDLDSNKSESKQVKKDVAAAVEAMKMWGQKMMVRLYGHMDIDAAEQVMIEQLAEHGVVTSDLTPALMQSARVKNPMADIDSGLQEHPKQESTASHASVSSKRSSYATPEEPGTPTDLSPTDLREVKSPSQLPPIKNIDIDLRWTVLCDLFLMLIADSMYDARSRKLLELVGEGLDVKWLDICRFEKRVTDALEMQEEAAKENWDEADHMEARRKKALKKKYMYMGLATVGGSLIIGLSAGLLAPVIGAGLAAGFTTIGVAGTSGFLAGAGGTALVTTIGITTGGSIAVKAAGRRMGAVRTFEYRPLHNNKRVNLIVTVSGWMNGKVDDVRLPFSTVDPIMGDIYSIHWEPDMLQSIGDTVRILATEALTSGLQQVLAATILTTLMAALALPVWLMKLSYLVDNPWSVSMDRADAAGLILADSLHEKNLGARPITLVGFSLGARVIFSCLKELANKGAHGLVQNVYLFGSPIVANVDDYNRARTVVAGRFVNAYATNDWILGYLFRATKGGISRVAGLKAIEGVPGLENLDVTELVQGHMAYRAAMPRLLRHVGWEVESDEFDEIVDPDPENHEARQRELIKEIEDARKEAEKPQKKKFGFFSRGKTDKKNWETYDERSLAEKAGSNSSHARKDSRVLFDIEAIKRELASEAIEVKELDSTLPPMQIDINSPKSTTGSNGVLSPNRDSITSPRRASIRASESYDGGDLPSEQEMGGGTPSTAGAKAIPNVEVPDRSSSIQQSTLPARPSGTGTSPLPSAALAWKSEVPDTPSPNPTHTRPDLDRVQTLPLEKNAWKGEDQDDDEDEEEEHWGEERQVVMSFE